VPDSQSRELMSMVIAADDEMAPANQPVRSRRAWRRPSAEYLRECGLSEEMLRHTDLLPDELLLILCWHEHARAWVLKNEGPITAALKTPAGTRDADRWDREGPILRKAGRWLIRSHAIWAVLEALRGGDISDVEQVLKEERPWTRRLLALLHAVPLRWRALTLKGGALPPAGTRPWLFPSFDPPEIWMPSGKEVQVLAAALWDAANGGKNWLRPQHGNPPYYAGEEGRQVYVSHATQAEVATITTEQETEYWKTVLEKLPDEKLLSVFLIALGKWFGDRGALRDQEDQPLIAKTWLHVSDILYFQGRKREVHGGYERADKLDVATHLGTLSRLIYTGPQVRYDRGAPRTRVVHSRYLEVAQENDVNLFGEETPYAFSISPGDWILPTLSSATPMLARLFRCVLQQNPRYASQRFAMRIGIYLTFQWRIRAHKRNWDQTWELRTLLGGASVPIEGDNRLYGRFLDYVEEALDRLRDLGAIGRWDYKAWHPDMRARRGWFARWLEEQVIITPPASLIEEYATIATSYRRAIASAKKATRKKHPHP